MVKVDSNGHTNGQSLPSRCGSTHKVSANIKVVVRVRPPNSREHDANHRTAIDVIDDQMLVFDPKEVDMPFFYQGVKQPSRGFLKRPNKELKFVFDQICDQKSSNRDVFDVTTKEMLPSLMEGYNCSVFVYGATGAGKTFTMIGSKDEPGITYLTMEHLFQIITSFKNDREFDIAVSYIEVYNENVFDLLKPSKYPLQLREDSKYGVMVVGLTLHNIKTARELLNMLENGNKNRTQHPTDANAESSRSHAVFQVYVNMRNKTSSLQRVVKLSMIDLAGSERAAATGCVGERFKEGANINRSLLSLGNCINKLADGNTYIPYRDSKLTRLLKDSLGGNCRTIMIANVSPSSLSYEDTYNTLKYAARAKKIQMSIKKNIVDGDVRVSRYVKINEELMKKVKDLETRLALGDSIQVVEKEPDHQKAAEWRERMGSCARALSELERQVLELMVRSRVLGVRHALRRHAFGHVIDLAHRSSSEAMEQMCNEDIPRQERASENHTKQLQVLITKITELSVQRKESELKLIKTLEEAVAEVKSLKDYADLIISQSSIRKLKAEKKLNQKLHSILLDEIVAFSSYMCEMPNLLKKLYLILKGYNKITPSLTTEYLDVMKTVKSGKTISWPTLDSDTESEEISSVLKLDLENPCCIPELTLPVRNKKGVEMDLGADLDVENQDPRLSAKKRKGTPDVNDTIVIDDSIEEDAFNSTKLMSGKKLKTMMTNNFAADMENFGGLIDPKNLNSTFVLAEKLEALKKEPATMKFVKKGLVDRTNILQRNNIVNDKMKISRPVVGRSCRWPVLPRPGFGSSLSRDGTPLTRSQEETPVSRVPHKSIGFKAMRARDRMPNHPYTRPNAGRMIHSRP